MFLSTLYRRNTQLSIFVIILIYCWCLGFVEPFTSLTSTTNRSCRERSSIGIGFGDQLQLDIMEPATDSYRTAIVLLDPVTEWKPVLEAALRLNFVVIGVQLSPISDSMRPFFPTASMLKNAGASHVLDLQDRDIFACVQALKLLTKQEKDLSPNESPWRIGAVIPLSETAVDFSDTISAMLGLENHNPLDTVLQKRDKGFMKEAVCDGGLAIAKFARLWGPADLIPRQKSLDLGYPVVVKTPQGFSSSDVYICSTQKEAEDALENILGHVGPDGRAPSCALLEEYIGGTEFAVNLMGTASMSPTQEGNDDPDSVVVVTDIWKYDKTEKARYKGATMCDPTDPALKEICDYAKGVAKSVGIQYGAAHVELKAKSTQDGDSYTNPIMMEVGARLSGGRKATMTQAAYLGSWDPFEALIESHLGVLNIDAMAPPPHHVHHIFLPVEKNGRIRKISSFLDNNNKADEDPSLHLTTLHSRVWLVKVGDDVQETKDITSCAGFVWLVGERDTVVKESELIVSSYKMEFE